MNLCSFCKQPGSLPSRTLTMGYMFSTWKFQRAITSFPGHPASSHLFPNTPRALRLSAVPCPERRHQPVYAVPVNHPANASALCQIPAATTLPTEPVIPHRCCGPNPQHRGSGGPRGSRGLRQGPQEPPGAPARRAPSLARSAGRTPAPRPRRPRRPEQRRGARTDLAAARRPPGESSWRWRHPPPVHCRPRRAGGAAPGPGAGSSRRRGLRGAGPRGACPAPWRRGERRGVRAGRGMTRRAGGAQPCPGQGAPRGCRAGPGRQRTGRGRTAPSAAFRFRYAEQGGRRRRPLAESAGSAGRWVRAGAPGPAGPSPPRALWGRAERCRIPWGARAGWRGAEGSGGTAPSRQGPVLSAAAPERGCAVGATWGSSHGGTLLCGP